MGHNIFMLVTSSLNSDLYNPLHVYVGIITTFDGIQDLYKEKMCICQYEPCVKS